MLAPVRLATGLGMLFNSYEFIFAFFPAAIAGFYLIGAYSPTAAARFLGLMSLLFYGWWSLQALPLLVGSIVFNYWLGSRLVAESENSTRRSWTLWFAVGANLSFLAVFKYADFFISTVNVGRIAGGGQPIPALHLVLPIGISFYTFTQIAFLVDCWQGKVRERSFSHYLLFVTYFPHLIAGPVLHHAQMMPQFAHAATYRPSAEKLGLGLATFTLGLTKKLVFADPLGQYADLVFDAVKTGLEPSLLTAWLGVIAYALQIYFDFSGYSDMAIGIALCLGVRLPINFLSPYKATSIIDFWRRWHISLSTFLRDYLYIPLGGSHKGAFRRYINLAVTMILGGLWHGASWTFVLWGTLHGLFLTVNHLWRAVSWPTFPASARPLLASLAWLLTFVCVCIAWVLFRADNLSTVITFYKGMLGLNGYSPSPFVGMNVPFKQSEFYQLLLVGFFSCVALPSSDRLREWIPRPIRWTRRVGVAVVSTALLAGVAFGYGVSRLGQHSPFLYFQF